MNKSIVRKLAFTLVLVLMIRTFMADYNSIGVRAESEAEDVTLNAIGDIRLDQELVDAIETASEDEVLTEESSNGEELTEADQNTQENGMEKENEESQESVDAVADDTAVQNDQNDEQQADAQVTEENQNQNENEIGEPEGEAKAQETHEDNVSDNEDAAVVDSQQVETDVRDADPADAQGKEVSGECEDEPTAPENETVATPEVTAGDASYTVNIYIRKLSGKYPAKPSRTIKSDSKLNPYGNAKIGETFAITPEAVVSYNGETYSYDAENENNVVEITMSEDASENAFNLYYVPKNEYETVAFYILLPQYSVPTSSEAQPDEQYFPEKGMGYTYERWTGRAFVDLYSLPNRDAKGNYWSKDNAPENSINQMIADGLIEVTQETKDAISKDLSEPIALKKVDERNISYLNEIKVKAGTKEKFADYSNIVWYVYKNTAGDSADDKAYHIDGYIANANVAVTYFTNFDANDNTMRTSDEFTGKYKIEDYGFEGLECKDGKLIRDGKWEFTGWNTERDGSGTSYAPGTEIDLMTSEQFYAQWTPILPDEIQVKVSLSATTDGTGRDTYIKYNGEPHRGDLTVNVTIEHEITTPALGADDSLVVLNAGAEEKDKVFAVNEKTADITLPTGVKVTATVSGLTVTGGYGEHVLANGAGYPITLETKGAKIKINGEEEYKGKIDFILDTSEISLTSDNRETTTTSAVIGNLYITPREVELVSPSAEKVYDGKPLTATDITVGAEGFAQGDSAEYSNFASQTKVGSTANTFEYKLNVAEPLDYSVKQVNGTLTVKKATKDKKPVKKKKNNPSHNDDPSSGNDSSVDSSNNDKPEVLGAIRPFNGDDNNGGSVLGSRRGATEDTTNTARLFVLIGAAAAVAILLFVGKKKKREEQ